jgi:TPR repeat protein
MPCIWGGVVKNWAEAVKHIMILMLCYRLADEEGDAEGPFRYGTYRREGEGIGVSLKEGARCWKLAHGQRHVASQMSYNNCFHTGQSVWKNMDEARQYCALPADK